MRIAELGTEVGESTRTIRYYESIGLLEQPPRTPLGYRDFNRSAAGRIRLIRTFQTAGFTLDDIARLLTIRDPTHRVTPDELNFIATRQAQIDARLAAATSLRAHLEELARTARVPPRDRPNTPITNADN